VQVTFAVHDGRAIFEGDIDLGPADSIPTTREAAARPGGPRYGVIRNSGWWQNGIVSFTIDPAFDAGQRQTILNALNHIKTVNPGVTFYEGSYSPRVHFRLVSDGCSSPVGRQGGVQNISLTAGCAYALPTVAHEMLHSLGMQHEQTRCDRDSYVRINWQNIKSGLPTTSSGTARATATSGSTTRDRSCITTRTPPPPTGFRPSCPSVAARWVPAPACRPPT
jgi:hypothetical protein